MKKVLVIIALFLVIFFVYITYSQRTTITTTLSVRAEEYIKQKKLDSEQWQSVTFQYPDKVISTDILGEKTQNIENECYAVNIPFNIERTQAIDTCSIQLFSNKPKVNVTITHIYKNVSSLAETPDIQMRRELHEKYKETEMNLNKQNYIIFEKQGFEYEKTAFTLQNGNMIAITVFSPSNRNLDVEFNRILENFVYFQ